MNVFITKFSHYSLLIIKFHFVTRGYLYIKIEFYFLKLSAFSICEFLPTNQKYKKTTFDKTLIYSSVMNSLYINTCQKALKLGVFLRERKCVLIIKLIQGTLLPLSVETQRRYVNNVSQNRKLLLNSNPVQYVSPLSQPPFAIK